MCRPIIVKPPSTSRLGFQAGEKCRRSYAKSICVSTRDGSFPANAHGCHLATDAARSNGRIAMGQEHFIYRARRSLYFPHLIRRTCRAVHFRGGFSSRGTLRALLHVSFAVTSVIGSTSGKDARDDTVVYKTRCKRAKRRGKKKKGASHREMERSRKRKKTDGIGG